MLEAPIQSNISYYFSLVFCCAMELPNLDACAGFINVNVKSFNCARSLNETTSELASFKMQLSKNLNRLERLHF